MSSRKVVIVAVALVVAIGTTYIVQTLTSKQTPSATGTTAAPAPKTVEVLVAARDLPSGTLLKSEDVKWQTWPENKEVLGLVTKDKGQITDYAGAVVRQGLRLGEPIISGRVVRKVDQGFMAAVLNPDMRAMSVSITAVGGVAGFVFPGDRVDVIVTHEVGRRTGNDSEQIRKVSETILQNVRVLALDQRSNDQVTEPKIAQTATLEVSAKQAEMLALVSQIGTIVLALRSLAHEDLDTAGITLDQDKNADTDVLETKTPKKTQMKTETDLTWDSDVSQVLPAPANRKGTVQRIQIMRGKETSETVFDLPQ